jgi:cytochrome c oxidase subunit 1
MFATGMNPYAPLVFAVLAASLGLPAALLLASWLGTLWNARFRLTTAMLFAAGFVSLFVAGGLSGLFLARQELTQAAVGEDFVTGHFHLVMGVAATFAILGALFFWFSKMFGCRLNETLGKIHFWVTFAGCMPFSCRPLVGTLTQSRMFSRCPAHRTGLGRLLVSHLVTVATIATVAAQLPSSLIFGTFVAQSKRGCGE